MHWQTMNTTLIQEASALQAELKTRLLLVETNVQEGTNVTAQSVTHRSLNGIAREFVGDLVDLPPFNHQISQETINKCGAVWTVLHQVGTLDQMPSATFGMLGIHPHEVQPLVGNAFWEACWDSEQDVVTLEHYIPFKMVKALKHILEEMAPSTIRCQSHAPAGQVVLDTLLAEKARLHAQASLA